MEVVFAQNISILSEVIAKLIEEKDALKVQLQETENERDLLLTTCEELNAEVETLLEEKRENACLVEQLEKENTELLTINASYASRCDEFEAENEELRENVEHLETSLQESEKTVQLMTPEVKSDDVALRNRVVELEEINDELLRKLRTEKKTNKALKGEKVELKQRWNKDLSTAEPRLRKRLMVRSSSEPNSKRFRIHVDEPALPTIAEVDEEGENYCSL
ncbi:hypothetical protein QR680_018361 [Steinernema hermaphroditum]|uniref:Uncharacterized protein n=1 Tax=Steinernema hermaphroditum TaxID=289476 RepID=A0AA39HHQ3_9BILA|nr:hypothetical protein QR680_018361 [Steinernema hermaphroditum]